MPELIGLRAVERKEESGGARAERVQTEHAVEKEEAGDEGEEVEDDDHDLHSRGSPYPTSASE